MASRRAVRSARSTDFAVAVGMSDDGYECSMLDKGVGRAMDSLCPWSLCLCVGRIESQACPSQRNCPSTEDKVRALTVRLYEINKEGCLLLNSPTLNNP